MAKQEKRRFERFTVKQLVNVSSSGDASFSAEGLDLSAGGLSCTVDGRIDSGSRVSVMLGLPYVAGENLVRCEGFVKHSRTDRNGKRVLGIEFTDISDEYRSMLQEYLSVLGAGS